ncbi:MAG: A/G-specific adenine glycosylase [Clostridiales bacterium]|nr:A/G-specific adenine glycosylase [Clostridiales bacterium]
MTPRNEWIPALLCWYETAKRDLPWRRTGDPYAVWISEIMLQQTRVEAVIAYYRRFLKAFPTIQALADAPQETVLKAWEGLGYYSRARNMHKAAKMICDSYGGVFPGSYAELRKLPGIGGYTAGAIASIAFGKPVPAVDGNVKRVASRLFGIRENVNRPAVIRVIRGALTGAIPDGQAALFNQALMELGATVCIPHTPHCETCPLAGYCDAYAAGDADSLPVIDRKKPPREVSVAVCLITHHNAVLVFKRRERLLQGLYVFGLAEDITDTAGAQNHLAERGLKTRFIADLGNARHVFTHRVWNMTIYRFELLKSPGAAFLRENDALLVEKKQLKALPLPVAMKAAKEAALKIL